MPRSWSAAVALLAFLLYLALCPPVSGDKDSAEFTVVLARLGVAHPTGYPLFTLFGHAWVTAVHALGAAWAFAANSWTALGGGVAVYFLQRLALALVAPARRSRRALFGLSLLPALAFALNPIWTYETTLVEVYAWHVAWALGAATLFTRLEGKDAPTLRDAALWGFVCGLGAAHHATSVFVIVPLSGVLMARRPSLVPAGILAGLVPLLAYAWIPWRAAHPSAPVWPMLEPGLAGLLDHVTGRQYVGLLGRFQPAPGQLNFLVWYVWPFLVPGLVLLVLHARQAREAAAYAIAAAALVGTIYAFSYGVPDPSSYFLFPMAFGLAAAPAVLARRPRTVWILNGAFLLLSVAWFGLGVLRANTMRNFDGLVTRMWQSIPFEEGFVFWNDDMHFKLEERQLLLHEKPGLFVVNANILLNAAPRRKFERAHGFDPMPGSTLLPDPEAAVENHVNAKTDLPVIDFDPQKQSVKLLKKESAGRDRPETAGPRS